MPFGIVELVLILLLVLMFFGPGKLPKAGEAISRSIGDIRRVANREGGPDEAAERQRRPATDADL
jgi:Sec-independent protein translocase protein TatA